MTSYVLWNNTTIVTPCVECTDDVIEQLLIPAIAQGYSFGTLDELNSSDGIRPTIACRVRVEVYRSGLVHLLDLPH